MVPMTVQLSDTGSQERGIARERRLYESRREREFYTYYESVLAYANTEPKFCNLHSPEAVAAHRAITSSDTTLTAFVQLAALQIGTRRAMIFFFDAEYAYVIAESTRTLSLQDDSQHGPDDSLWLGFTKIPRGLSVCEVTADLPANKGSNAQDPSSTLLAHIINDLAEDTRFCDRPYVKDGPKARFYAGVPITTPKGINIGALCVLDDKPRDGLESNQIEFLRSMASTVMSHLELVRAKEGNQRSKNMNSALAAFVEGRSNSADWWHHNARSRNDVKKEPTDDLQAEFRGPRNRTLNERIPSDPYSAGALLENAMTGEYFEPNIQGAITNETGQLPIKPPFNPPVAQENSLPTEPVGLLRSTLDPRAVSADVKDPTSPTPTPNTGEDIHESDLPTRIRATAIRAASLIQKGVSADGVLFLDATVGSVGGPIDSTQGLSQTETETDGSRVSDTNLEPVRPDHHDGRDTIAAKKLLASARESVILGSAYSADIEARVKSAIEQAKFSEKVLKSLLRRYPNGQVWHFNAEGDASDEDDEILGENTSATDAGESAGSEVEASPSTTPTSKRAHRRARARKRDGRAIQGIFPGIRSLIFLGMWDSHQDRWFGASIAVSYSSMRIFSAQNELSYIAAFSDVVLAEIWRLEAQALGRSKNEFVSSISHELRSPLGERSIATRDSVNSTDEVAHGILGSAECLEDQQHSALSAELIRSITSCGMTLLDIVNDLLEYSHLNHDTQNRRKVQLTRRESTRSANSTTASDASVLDAEAESGFNISTLTEEAVTAACLGFDQRRLPPQDLHGANGVHSAVLVLNIDEALGLDWMFSIASGSWKRICINLVSNALKYTPSGYINVTLRKTWLKRKASIPRTALVELVVEDSGIGMSDDFQVKSLFRPFQQENSLASGTGLGLNLVAQIVKSLGGTVHVRSNKGRGTTVKVALPLRPLPSALPTKSYDESRDVSFPSATVGFFGFGALETDPATERSTVKANRRLLSSMKKYCMQLGITVQATDDHLNSNTSYHIVSEQALHRSSQINDKDLRRPLLSTDSLRKPMIVVCATRESASRLRSGPLGSSLPDATQYLWLPIGPAKLSDALSKCRVHCADGLPGAGESLSCKTDTITAKMLVASMPEVTAQGAAQTSSKPIEDQNDSAQTPQSTYASAIKCEDDSTISIPGATAESTDKLLQIQQSPRTERSGSESVGRSVTSPLSLPVQSDRATTAPCVSTQEMVSVLLVDDNSINLRLLEVFAKKAGYTYRTAQNGQEAVESYKNSANQQHPSEGGYNSNVKSGIKPEVILMDINMPVMDGFEAARAIRRFEHASGSSRATIIAVTGLGDRMAQERAFASGMDLFLTKPVKMKDVTAIVSGLRRTDHK